MNENKPDSKRIAEEIVKFLKTQSNSELLKRFYFLWQDTLDFISYLELCDAYYHWSQDKETFMQADQLRKNVIFPKSLLPDPNIEN
jgi:hypothetical protein